MLPGARGFGVPGSGGSRLSVAATGRPASVPAIAPLLPDVTVPEKCSVLPFTHFTSPVSRLPSFRRSFPPRLPCAFVKFTNSPDCFTSNDGPPGLGCAGAVGGSGGRDGAGGGAPRHAFGAAAS